MTAIAPAPRTAAEPGPCLTSSPAAGRIIGLLFLLTVALFLLGLIALGL
jgi:hypothetical protein